MKQKIKAIILEKIEQNGMFQFTTPWGVKAILNAALELEKDRKITIYSTYSTNNDGFIAVKYVDHPDVSIETGDMIDELLK